MRNTITVQVNLNNSSKLKKGAMLLPKVKGSSKKCLYRLTPRIPLFEQVERILIRRRIANNVTRITTISEGTDNPSIIEVTYNKYIAS